MLNVISLHQRMHLDASELTCKLLRRRRHPVPILLKQHGRFHQQRPRYRLFVLVLRLRPRALLSDLSRQA